MEKLRMSHHLSLAVFSIKPTVFQYYYYGESVKRNKKKSHQISIVIAMEKTVAGGSRRPNASRASNTVPRPAVEIPEATATEAGDVCVPYPDDLTPTQLSESWV